MITIYMLQKLLFNLVENLSWNPNKRKNLFCRNMYTYVYAVVLLLWTYVILAFIFHNSFHSFISHTTQKNSSKNVTPFQQNNAKNICKMPQMKRK